MASDFDGAFAQFVKAKFTEVFPVKCSLSDVELGSFPCAYGTSENMLIRGALIKGEVNHNKSLYSCIIFTDSLTPSDVE
jgi:hypothetical protein